MNRASIIIAALVALALTPTASAVNPVTWNVTLSTTGQDVFWTSPTALTLGYPEYDWSYEITKLDALVAFSTVDLLGQLESTTGSGTTTTLPAVIVDESLSESTTGSTADIRIEIDANGLGRASATNIELGFIGPFRIQRVDLEALVTVIGIPDGDYNRDSNVTFADYEVWKGNFGSTVNLNADGNDNNIVDTADYSIWRDAYNSAPGAGAVTAVPEPAIASCLVVAIAALTVARRRLPRV